MTQSEPSSFRVVDRRSGAHTAEHPTFVDNNSNVAPGPGIPDPVSSSNVSTATSASDSPESDSKPETILSDENITEENRSEENRSEENRSEENRSEENKAETTGGPSFSDRSTLSELLVQVAIQMDVPELVTGLIGIFSAHSWCAMGLIPNPVTGDMAVNLPEAQLAIDCAHFLFGKVEKDLPEAECREMKRRLNDLRMNYLERARPR